MQRAILCGLILVLGAACAGVPSDHPPAEQILVTFPVTHFVETLPSGSQRSYHGGSLWAATLHTRAMVRSFARQYDLQLVEGWAIESIGAYCVAFAAGDRPVTAGLLDVLRADDRADIVQLNNTFRGMTRTSRPYNDPLVDIQYGGYRGALEQLHAITKGENVRIGVLDSTVDGDHPDLIGQIRKQHVFTRASRSAAQLHGTAVAGVIGAAADNREGVVGLAPRAELIVFGACAKDGDDTTCTSFALAKALAAVIEQKIDVLNISLAGPADPLIEKLLGAALRQDMIIVAAANPQDDTRNFPASLAGVIAAEEGRGIWFASSEALSTQAGGGYQVFYGSSISAAGLSGMATLLRSRLPAAAVRAALHNLLDTDCWRHELSPELHRLVGETWCP